MLLMPGSWPSWHNNCIHYEIAQLGISILLKNRWWTIDKVIRGQSLTIHGIQKCIFSDVKALHYKILLMGINWWWISTMSSITALNNKALQESITTLSRSNPSSISCVWEKAQSGSGKKPIIIPWCLGDSPHTPKLDPSPRAPSPSSHHQHLVHYTFNPKRNCHNKPSQIISHLF